MVLNSSYNKIKSETTIQVYLKPLNLFRYQEFMFSLPPDKVYLRGQGITSIESLQLRIAIQGENGGQIVAMSTVGYDELEMKVSR